MTEKPIVLVTNDDGYDSHFLHILTETLSSTFKVYVAAPATEQSWIGRAVSRRKAISVTPVIDRFSPHIQAWKIEGTPTDCVNIALGHLLPKEPSLVLSGINVGFNTSEPLILSSGTIAGAIEGSLWGIPSIAFSQSIPSERFEAIAASKGQILGDFLPVVEASAIHAARIAQEILQHPPEHNVVTNINFPSNTHIDSKVEKTFPIKIRLGSLYAPEDKSKDSFRFRYGDGEILDNSPMTDRAALRRGSISHSTLDFSRIGIRPESSP